MRLRPESLGFVKIRLRANFNQANLKTDIISQIYSDNKLLLNDVPDNKEPTQEPKNRKVNVHLQTNVVWLWELEMQVMMNDKHNYD